LVQTVNHYDKSKIFANWGSQPDNSCSYPLIYAFHKLDGWEYTQAASNVPANVVCVPRLYKALDVPELQKEYTNISQSVTNLENWVFLSLNSFMVYSCMTNLRRNNKYLDYL